MEYPTNKEAGARKPTNKETGTPPPQKDVAEVVIDVVFDKPEPEPASE